MTASEPLANWNGQEMPLKDVRVSVLDRAFLFGDAVYEVLRVYRGTAFRLDDHMRRLQESLEALSIKGVDLDEVRRRLLATLKSSQVADGLIYVQITRGEARRTHSFPAQSRPNQLIWAERFVDMYVVERDRGAKAITHPDIRWQRNDIKATSLLANCIAAQAARAAGAAEAILIGADDLVTEGSHTTIFGVRDGKIIISPNSAQVLPGITKRQVMELAGETGIPLIEGRLKKDDLLLLDELFMTGTPEEIIAIVEVDGARIGTGGPGPIVEKLQKAFRKKVDSWLAKVLPA